jgi:LysR family transcriptional regulator, hydrogen peroxide-inducible genes activator
VNAYLAKSLAERPDVIPDVIEASSLEMLLQLVAAGVGCSLLPTLAASPDVVGGQPDSVCFRSLAPPAPTRTLGIAWRRGYSRTPSLLGLARFLHTNLPTIVEPLSLDKRGRPGPHLNVGPAPPEVNRDRAASAPLPAVIGISR